MPIKDFEVAESASPPWLGLIRKGGKRPADGKRPGPDLNQKFRFATDDEDTMREFVARFGAADGLTSLRVLLPYANAFDNLVQWYEVHRAGTMLYRHDGEFCALWLTKDGVMHSADKEPALPVSAIPLDIAAEAKLNTTLFVYLQDWQRLALVRVLSTSFYDAQELYRNLLFLHNLRSSHECRGIPLILRRVVRRVTTPETENKGGKIVKTGKKIKRAKWLWNLEVRPEYSQAVLDWDMQRALPGQAEGQLGAGGAALGIAAASEFVRAVPRPPEANPTHVDPDSPFAQVGDQEDDDDGGEDGEDGFEEGEFTPMNAESGGGAFPVTAEVARSAAATFSDAAKQLADTWTIYRHEGKPDYTAMLQVIGGSGVALVTLDNLAWCVQVLTASATEKTLKH